jgi:hypothetical protein
MNYKLKAKIIERFGYQWKFAQFLEIDEAVISRVLRGSRQLDDAAKKQWADALGSTEKELFLDAD